MDTSSSSEQTTSADAWPSNVPQLLQNLEVAQYDLNTCLRETDVVLKSFVFALPDAQLDHFDFALNGLARVWPVPAAAGLLDSGRINLLAGQ